MKPYVFEIPGVITVTLDEQAMMKIHDYYEVQNTADEIKDAYPKLNNLYCEALAKKVRSLMWNEEMSEEEAIEEVTDKYPSEDLSYFASYSVKLAESILANRLPECLSDMEDISEILMAISDNVALYAELQFPKVVKEVLMEILELTASLLPVTVAGPEDVKRLQEKLYLLKQKALQLITLLPVEEN